MIRLTARGTCMYRSESNLFSVLALNALLACMACDPADSGPLADFDEQPEEGGPASVTKMMRVNTRPGVQVGRDIGADLSRHVETAELGDADELIVRSEITSGPLRHVRLDQMHRGVRVWGADVAAHLRTDKLVLLSGSLVRGLDVDVTPTLTVDRALAAAVADLASAEGRTEEFERQRQRTEMVIVRSDDGARLAWHLEFFTEADESADPGRWNFLVDAHDGSVLQRWNALHTLEQASGFGGNGKVTRYWTAELDVEPQGDEFKMDTDRMVTLDMAHDVFGGEVVTGPLEGIGDRIINDAHGHTEVALDMLSQWFGHDSIDDDGFKIVNRVHYSHKYENAFWDGEQMTYGDGGSTFYPLAGALDVVAHEINHGFTEFHSKLEYFGQSGGMNESFSDIAGTAAEFFRVGEAADFEVGEDIMLVGGSLRSMCDPSVDGLSIDHMDDYDDGLDVHFSSGIMNKAFCRAAKRLSSGDPEGTATVEGVQRTARAFFAANAHYWTASSTFVQGCQGVLDAAADLDFSEAEVQALQVSWQDVGVNCGSGD
jgi:Zn-dependent metalloprotease